MLSQAGEQFCLIGGLAVQRWGEPRVTRDVDLTLLYPFSQEAAAADLLFSAFKPRIAGARDFALRNPVLLLWAGDGIGIDVALGSLPFEARCVRWASVWEIAPGVVLRICSTEDLLVLKAFAGQPRAALVGEAIGYQGGFVYDASKPDGTHKKLLDTSRLVALGWQPRIGLHEGVTSTYRDFLACGAAA
ncbi:MAG: hypothetical protein O3A06_06415 [Proteobacteria bacterium]|nr:hypothetical protein [Pseudomonadota bacterium]